VTSLSIEYRGEDDQVGVYHSNYDSFDHYVRFGDPDFAYGVAEAQTVGHIVLRMADAELLPLQFAGFADTGQLSAGAAQARGGQAQQRRRARPASGSERLRSRRDPTRVVLPPQREPAVPVIDFAPLDAVVARLKTSAQAYDESYAHVVAADLKLSARGASN